MNHLLTVLRESYEGPERTPCYLDTGTGLRDTLAALSASDASRGEGRTSIAAHTHHVKFSFQAFGAGIRGESPLDWNESWSVSSVDDAEWRKLQDELAREYATFYASVQSATSEEALHAATVGVAHLAYHLGAIRARL